MGNIKMTRGKTKSYGLFTWQRDVVVNFNFFMRNVSSASMIFFRHVSLTIVPYAVDIDDVSTIDDQRSVKVNVSAVSFLNSCRRWRCINDQWLAMVVVPIHDLSLEFYRCQKRIDDVKKLSYRPNFVDCQSLEKVLDHAYFGPFTQCCFEKLYLSIVLNQTKYGRW